MKKSSLSVIPFIFVVCPAFAQNEVKALETATQVGNKVAEQTALLGDRVAQSVLAREGVVYDALVSAVNEAQVETIPMVDVPELKTFRKSTIPSPTTHPDVSVSQVSTKQTFYNALMDGKLEIAQDLLDKTGQELMASNDVYFLCVNLLRWAGHEKQITFLLENGLNPNKILLNIPLIHQAVLYEGQSYLPILKKYGADLNIQSGISKATPLHWAIYNYATTRELIKLGANPAIANANGHTPQQLAHLKSETADEWSRPELEKVDNYYYHAIYTVNVPNGTAQPARVLFPSEVLAAVKPEGRVYIPAEFSVADNYIYQGVQLKYLSDVKEILKYGLVINADNFVQAFKRALPARADIPVIENNPEQLRIPVVVKTLFSMQAEVDNTFISPASIASVMVFLEINGTPGWYSVTLQKDGELLFTPVPTAFASTYFFR